MLNPDDHYARSIPLTPISIKATQNNLSSFDKDSQFVISNDTLVQETLKWEEEYPGGDSDLENTNLGYYYDCELYLSIDASKKQRASMLNIFL